jgi:hypothetical protein
MLPVRSLRFIWWWWLIGVASKPVDTASKGKEGGDSEPSAKDQGTVQPKDERKPNENKKEKDDKKDDK